MTPHLFPPTVNCEGWRRFSTLSHAPTADATPTNTVLTHANPSPDADAPRKIFETRIASSEHHSLLQCSKRRGKPDPTYYGLHCPNNIRPLIRRTFPAFRSVAGPGLSQCAAQRLTDTDIFNLT